jgi:hypothetical protein
MKVCEVAETIGISKECAGYILHEELDMLGTMCIKTSRKTKINP